MKVKINVQQKVSNSYLLFSGDQYYPYGGWEDFRGSFTSVEDAMKAFDERMNVDGKLTYPWAHVVNPYGIVVWHYTDREGAWKVGSMWGDEK